MQSIQNFAFEEHLVRAIERDGAPWFVGKDVCSALDIKNHNDALNRLDPDEKGVANADPLGTFPRGGGAQETVIVNEPGVFRLIFTSRKPEAERFKRWLAHDVLPQIRRTGAYAPAEPEIVRSQDAEAPLGQRVDAVRMARALFGPERARALWQELGLPHVPPPSPFHGAGEAAHCLRMLLDHQLGERAVRALLLDASEGAHDAALALEAFGIHAGEGEGFTVSNSSWEVWNVYAGTQFADKRWILMLRRLSGVRAGDRESFPINNPPLAGRQMPATGKSRQTRTTFLPYDVLDEDYLRGL